MKANKIIRVLVEENIKKTEEFEKLLTQQEMRIQRQNATFEREREYYTKGMKGFREEVRRLTDINVILKKRLIDAGLDSEVNLSDVALAEFREKLTGEWIFSLG